MLVTFTATTALPETDLRVPHLYLADPNATRILQILGFATPHHDTGHHDATDFQARILIACAFTGPGRYLSDRLLRLHHLASWAIAHQATVTWQTHPADTLQTPQGSGKY